MIWAIILAAGESLRMGMQKLLLPYRGTTVIETIVRAALDSSVDETLVVIGADREKVREVLKSYPLTFAVNKDYKLGMLSSVQTGFRALPERAEAAVVMLGDQPSIPANAVDDLVESYRKSRRGIFVPLHGGRRGHPVLIGAEFREEVLRLDPDIGLRQLLRAHPEAVVELEASSAEVLRDMDLPENYRNDTGRVLSRGLPGRSRPGRRGVS